MDGARTGLTSAVVRYFYLKQVTSYATASSMVLILHEFVTTFSQEVELVWLSPWSAPKIVYLINRYSSLIMASIYMFALFFAAHTPSRCEALGAVSGWQSWISTTLVQLTLLIWLSALYHRNRRLLFPVSAIYVVLSITVLCVLVPFGGKLRFIMSDPLCVQTVSPNTDNNDKDDSLIEAVTLDNIAKFPTYMLILVLAWATYTAFLLSLIAYKVTRTFNNHDERVERDLDERGLAYLLIRDSVLYGFIIFCLVLTNVVMTAATPTALNSAALGFNVVVPWVLSSRILLNLRQWERYRESRVNVQGVNLTEWRTMFHLTTDHS